jgi:hypothetical protein
VGWAIRPSQGQLSSRSAAVVPHACGQSDTDPSQRPCGPRSAARVGS